MSRHRALRSALVAAAVLLGPAAPASAILIRHDRDDARYRALGARYPAVCLVSADGEGTLVAPTWVLTAAHVAVGIRPAKKTVTFAGNEHAIARVVLHPRWKDGGPHDVALLELAAPVEGIAPVPIFAGEDETGMEVVFVGRGDTGTGLTGPKSLDRVVRGATNRVDRVDADWLHVDFDRSDSPGATDLEGISGPGDSGGPALAEVGGRLVVLGVSVWGSPPPEGRGRYGAGEGYTRLSTHRPWIASVMVPPAAPTPAQP